MEGWVYPLHWHHHPGPDRGQGRYYYPANRFDQQQIDQVFQTIHPREHKHGFDFQEKQSDPRIREYENLELHPKGKPF